MTRLLIHQPDNILKVIENFNMDKSYLSIVIRSLEIGTNQFRQQDFGEKIMGHGFPCINVIGALMYLIDCTRSCICSKLASSTQRCSYQTLLNKSGTYPQIYEYHRRSWTISKKKTQLLMWLDTLTLDI